MPGQYYIYIPWNDAGFYDEAKKWQDAYTAMLTRKLRVAATIMEYESAGEIPHLTWNEMNTPSQLESVKSRKRPIICMHDHTSIVSVNRMQAEDTVYVLGHCRSGLVEIHNNSGGKLEPEALVDRMLSDGIPRDLKKIKLWCCEGAAGNKSFAKEFYKEAHDGKFVYAEVTGYTKTVKNVNQMGHKRAITGWQFKPKWGWPFDDTESRASSVAVHFPPRAPSFGNK